MKRQRFTLFEMLAVIVVIAILLSLLFSSYSRARRHALTAVCLSNLHNTHVALMVYGRGNKYVLPMPYVVRMTGSPSYDINMTTPGKTWGAALVTPGLTSIDNLHCPEAYNTRGQGSSLTVKVAGGATQPIGARPIDQFIYGLRGGVLSNNNRYQIATDYNRIANPSGDILVCDTSHPGLVYSNWNVFDYTHGTYMVHSGKAGVCFSDGSGVAAGESRLDQIPDAAWGTVQTKRYYYPSGPGGRTQ